MTAGVRTALANCARRSRAGVDGEHPQVHFAGARNAQGRAEARLVVLIGDVQTFELFGMRVLAETIVIEAQVHRRRVRRP